MDFFNVCTREVKSGVEVYPDFIVGRTKDLMVRGKAFYAIWDEEAGLWSTDEYDVQRLVDAELKQFAENYKAEHGISCKVKYLRSFTSSGWSQFRKYIQNISDNSQLLDQKLTFADSEVKKTDYASKRLPYSHGAGDYSAWDELVGTLYSVDERRKIEWAIGAVVSGDSKKIQKFLVFYGPGGTGKSTIMNIIARLFEGYTTTFDAKALGNGNASFATEVFKSNPLVAIQQDGDLSKIDDNTRLNSIISHEEMTMNEKYKSSYTAKVNAFLFMGTNQPVKISDAKSGIIRRLIDVSPTGVRIAPNHYQALLAKIEFELGAIAQHCLDIYLELGKNYFNAYRPLEMMFQTDVFFNFIEAYYDVFKAQNGVSLKQAYVLYTEYCKETGIDRPLPQYKVREELRNYFDDFKDRYMVDDETVRSYYLGFNANKFKAPGKDVTTFSLVMEEEESALDILLAEMPAQLATPEGAPKKRWADVTTVLKDIDTKETHFVKVPENHIVIDFDLKDPDGRKSLERNLEAASSWPATYAELSKSGAGVHLHYHWTGTVEPTELATHHSDGIEVKHFRGDASLRRRVSKCNSVPVADLSSGLAVKEKSVIPQSTMNSEKGLRDLIFRNLRKEIHPGTKPSIDFIKKILDDAYSSGMVYDVTDLRGRLIAFANNSSNQSLQCLKIVQIMKFASDEQVAVEAAIDIAPQVTEDRIVFFDVEVYPNLFVVCWKYDGADSVVRMINPSAIEMENLFKFKLVGFNNRRYDNHMCYGRFMGYDNEALYRLSQRLINNQPAMFGEAYNLSYADIYDFSSLKQSLKKFQIQLGLNHLELDIPWDQPVPESEWKRVADYCANDVESTEATFHARKGDFRARQILAELSGLTVNDTTAKHTAQVIFGADRGKASKSFVYTDLSKTFPGYSYERGKSSYRGEDPGEGGYVYAEPGMYTDVALLDVASMHPASMEVMNVFGPYTEKYNDLRRARIGIKRKDYETVGKMFDGKLEPYLDDPEQAEALSYALKIVINTVYGLTSAKFDNPFRDPRNKDNIVAKRGALFMIDLKYAVQEQGFTVAHIKTDSIKIPNATPGIIEFVKEFGARYGYEFEHEATYDKFALVNDAVYVAKDQYGWHATGAQFAHPYVYKSLFTEQEFTFDDYCETKQVSKGHIYIDYDAVQKTMFAYEGMVFIGRTGRFVPVTTESGGGILYRVTDEKKYAVTGTKGHVWLEAHVAKANLNDIEIDETYFDNLVYQARKALGNFGDVDEFIYT